MSTVVVADPLAAVAAYLQASAVGQMLQAMPHGPAVYRPSLPQKVQKHMPFACIVVRPAGGYTAFGVGPMPLADPRIDFTCYADEPQMAYEIALATAVALKALRMSIWENTKLFPAQISGGPIGLPDTETLWPAAWVSAKVTYAEIAAGGNQEA